MVELDVTTNMVALSHVDISTLDALDQDTLIGGVSQWDTLIVAPASQDIDTDETFSLLVKPFKGM